MEATILECVIFTGFVYWMCSSFINDVLLNRIVKMVDIVTTRMFDTFNRFSPSQSHQTDSLSTISSLKRFSRDQRYKKAISREADIRNRDNQLFDIKENAPDVQITKARQFVGLSCQNCTITSRESFTNKTTDKMALKNIYTYTPANNREGFIQRIFYHLYQNYNLKKFNFQLVNQSVLEDQRVISAVELMAKEQFQDVEEKDEQVFQKLVEENMKRARRLVTDMKSSISDLVLRCASWVMQKVLPCFISSVLVHPGQINMIKEASKSGLPLIFLPLHRSHLDYILVTLILLNNNIKSPIVAAGNNLKLPLFGSLLRGLGAFYIKRRIDPVKGHKDHVYKAILHTYMNHSLKAGHNMEFYIEGGRTRTGKPVMPKFGVLSVIVDSFMDGTIEDALLVPVSINYDKLVDGNFVKEQLGEPKEMESFGKAVKALWYIVNSDYGMVKIDFNQPFSLRELVKAFNMSNTTNGKKMPISRPSAISLNGTDVPEENKMLIENISRHVLYDSTQSISVMATNVVAFLLLTRYRQGAKISELRKGLDSLREELEYSRKEIAFQGDSQDVINYAVDMLGNNLVCKERLNDEDVTIRPVITLPNVIELSYYGATLVPHFAIESIIAIAIDSIRPIANRIKHEDLLDSATALCNIMQYEFIFCKPCQSLEQTINYRLDELIVRKQIFQVENESALQLRSRRIAKQFDEDDEESNGPMYYTINDDDAAQDTLKFYRSVVYPLLECYAVTAVALETLVGRTLLERDLIKEILGELRKKLKNQSIRYDEAVSVDTVKNALKLCVTWGILECHNEGKLRLYYLSEKNDSHVAVRLLYNTINKYRQSANK